MNNMVPIQPQRAAGITFADMELLADSIARSGLFGMKTREQALSLMAIAQAEGRHPAIAARDYDIIQGRPSKKSDAMLRDFLEAGGKVEWHALSDATADATFSHPAGGTVRITWDMKRAQAAGLGGKDMWKKYPRQMLRSRTVSEGVRTVCPSATSGMYVPEEVTDFVQAEAPRTVAAASIPAPTIEAPHDPATGEVSEPCAIPVPEAAKGGSDWVTWGGRFVAACKSAASRAVLDAWVAANAAALKGCEANHAKAHARVQANLAEIRAKFPEEPPVITGEPEWLEPDDTGNALAA